VVVWKCKWKWIVKELVVRWVGVVGCEGRSCEGKRATMVVVISRPAVIFSDQTSDMVPWREGTSASKEDGWLLMFEYAEVATVKIV
jgi:hypothetical protein